MAQEFLNDISPTYCALPWIHMATFTNGTPLLCCVANPPLAEEELNLNYETIKEIWNSPHWKRARKAMIAGKKVPACSHCYKEEDAGIRSHRMNENNLWCRTLGDGDHKKGKAYLKKLIKKTKKDGTLNEDLITLDLRLGNTCNLQCTMCRPVDSSKWVKDADKIINLTSSNVQSDWIWKRDDAKQSDFDWVTEEDFWNEELIELLPNMRHIIFAGGEPLYLKIHTEFLEKIVELGYAKNIQLRYHTNATILPDKILELWKEFQYVELMLSIDAIDQQNYWLRYPADWKTIEENLQKIDAQGEHLYAKILCTVNAINVIYLADFAEWILSQKYKKIGLKDHNGLFHPGILHYPEYMCTKILPQNVKNLATSNIDKLQETYPDNNQITNIKNAINFMNLEDNSHLISDLKQYITAIDRMRQTSFDKTFPELAQLLK
jgi:organic radical activating enzyme